MGPSSEMVIVFVFIIVGREVSILGSPGLFFVVGKEWEVRPPGRLFFVGKEWEVRGSPGLFFVIRKEWEVRQPRFQIRFVSFF